MNKDDFIVSFSAFSVIEFSQHTYFVTDSGGASHRKMGGVTCDGVWGATPFIS